MKVIWRPVCGSLAQAKEMMHEFESIMFMFDFLVDHYDQVFDRSDLALIYYCGCPDLGTDTYLVMTRCWGDEDLRDGPVPVGFVEFE